MKYKKGDIIEVHKHSPNGPYPTDIILILEDNNYIFRIEKVTSGGTYVFRQVNGKELNGSWSQECVKGIYEETIIIFKEKVSRFQLMDLT